MKIADVLPELTIQPLRRFADAWDVSTIKSDKRDVFEQAILGEASRIGTEEAVLQRLAAFEREIDYVHRTNAEMLLRRILDVPDYVIADECELIKGAVDADAAFFEYARGNASTRHLDQRSIDIYQSVLEVAWENKVSFDEYQLIERLRRKLNIARRDHRVMEIKVVRTSPIGPQEAEQALRDLSYHGFVCRFKRGGHTQAVLPEEIALRLRGIYGISLQSSAYRNLAAKLPIAVIRETLQQANQPAVSLKKEFLVERLIDGDVPPATLLEHLDNDALDELLANFPDEKPPPTMRAVKIRHLISHFDRFASGPVVPPPDGPDRIYYDHLVELASRQYDVLRARNVIERDQNVDRAFERGVRYAFSRLLGHLAKQFTGSSHADGGVVAKKGRMVLWDCKSSLEPYALTEVKCAQFLNYVHKEAPNVVCPFLVFSGEFTGDSQARALELKTKCPPGTEIALMTAADLKWLADKWNKEYPDKRLPLDVLAHSGLLNSEILQLRLELFAGQAQDREVAK
jgi:hypothetical protein